MSMTRLMILALVPGTMPRLPLLVALVVSLQVLSPLAIQASDRDCADFASQEDAIAWFEAQGGSASRNVDGLDGDGDGIPCERLRRTAIEQAISVILKPPVLVAAAIVGGLLVMALSWRRRSVHERRSNVLQPGPSAPVPATGMLVITVSGPPSSRLPEIVLIDGRQVNPERSLQRDGRGNLQGFWFLPVGLHDVELARASGQERLHRRVEILTDDVTRIAFDLPHP